MNIRNSGKFSQSIQCLLLEHWKGKCMTENSTFTTDSLSNLLQTWHDSELQICVFSTTKICRKSAKLLELSQTILSSPSSIYLQRYCSRDRPFRKTYFLKKEVCLSPEKKAVLWFLTLDYLAEFLSNNQYVKDRAFNFWCCRSQHAKTVVLSNINHYYTRNLSPCL